MKKGETAWNKGFRWINNGEIEYQINNSQDIPNGFSFGRIPKSEEARKKISESKKGNVPWNKGIKMSEEFSMTCSKAQKKRFENDNERKKCNNRKGRKVYHNGNIIKLFYEGEVPEGFVEGYPYRPNPKQSEYMKGNKLRLGKKFSEETLKKMSESHKGKKRSKESIAKSVNSRTGYHHSKETIEKIKESRKYAIPKGIETKRKNNTFNTSSEEILVKNELLKIFDEDSVKKNYKCKKYPFNCDFYVKPLDLFIELNIHPTHGGHPFDENNEEDINKLQELMEKSKYSKFYKNVIKVWTKNDVNKLNYAIKNKLNYIAVYPEYIFNNTDINNDLYKNIGNSWREFCEWIETLPYGELITKKVSN